MERDLIQTNQNDNIINDWDLMSFQGDQKLERKLIETTGEKRKDSHDINIPNNNNFDFNEENE